MIKSIVYTSVGGGYCSPNSYDSARTVYTQPINIKDKRLYGHPTIKPLNIIQTLVTNSSREGDTVLDMFMGSGTTMVACVNTKRNGIGIELDENYFKIAQERVKEAQQQLTLF
ncbi:MAG: site-specific DNA-methyltransferase [Lachnospiraceae bacterium]|nr:site-specific DNA-methyltransferase [Lachnospiraceae bacterium]